MSETTPLSGDSNAFAGLFGDGAAYERMMGRAFWEQAGLAAVETRVIRIRVSFADFDDFWDSMNSPVGPAGHADQQAVAGGEGEA